MAMHSMEILQISLFLFITVAFKIRQNRDLMQAGVIKRDKQFTYNRMLRRLYTTLFEVYVCSLIYPACNVHAPHCHLWTFPLYFIFSHYLTKCMILEKKILNLRCVFLFSLQIVSETFLIPRRNERYIIKTVHWSSCKLLVFVVVVIVVVMFLSDFHETRIFSTYFRKLFKQHFVKIL